MSNEIELNAFLFEKDREIKELKEEIINDIKRITNITYDECSYATTELLTNLLKKWENYEI